MLAITGANDPPTITDSKPAFVTMSEDGSPTAFDLTLNATDPENDTLTWSIRPERRPPTALFRREQHRQLQAHQLYPDADYNGSDSFVVQVDDVGTAVRTDLGQSDHHLGQRRTRVTTSVGTSAFTEVGGAVTVDSAVTVSDVGPTPTWPSATVTISNLLDTSLETLAATTTGTSITASYVAPTLTLSGSDTKAHYQQVLQSVTYNDSSQNPSTTTRTLNFVANDGALDSTTATKSVSVTAVNDAPTASNLSAPESYTEDAGAVDLTDIVTADVDNASLTATLTLEHIAAGTLSTATSGSITSTFAAGVWNASGPICRRQHAAGWGDLHARAELQRRLPMCYQRQRRQPRRTGTQLVSVSAVNDAPSGTNNTITLLDDGSHTFAAADFGFGDAADSPANTFSAVTITTLPANGSLEAPAWP